MNRGILLMVVLGVLGGVVMRAQIAGAAAQGGAAGGGAAVPISMLDLKKARGKVMADKNAKGETMMLSGKKQDLGIGVQGNSLVVIDLKDGAKSFSVTVGADDAAGEEGAVRFYVIGDGKLLAESGIMHGHGAAKELKADLTGIKQLVLRTDDVSNKRADDFGDWVNPTIMAAGDGPVTVAADQAVPELQVWVDQLDLTKATQGWNETGVNVSAEYHPVTLKGKTFLHAVGTHANGLIVINLKGAAKTFTAIAGIDDDAEDEGSCGFTVIGDGKVLTKTGTINRQDAVKKISVDVTGVKQLVLQVDSGDDDNINNDHADWAEALITLDPAKAKDQPETVAASQAKLPG
jgi:NPCBM/NEW2 domain